MLGLNPHWVPQRTGGNKEFWGFAATEVGTHGQIPAHLTGKTQVILVTSTLQLVSHRLFLDSFRLSNAGNRAGNTTAMVRGAEPSLKATPWASNQICYQLGKALEYKWITKPLGQTRHIDLTLFTYALTHSYSEHPIEILGWDFFGFTSQGDWNQPSALRQTVKKAPLPLALCRAR